MERRKKVVVVFSRHDLLPAEVDTIKKVYGDPVIIYYKQYVPNAEFAMKAAEEAGASAILAILPLSFIMRLAELARERGVDLLIPEMERLYQGYDMERAQKLVAERPERRVLQQYDTGVIVAYEFVRFKRVHRVEIVGEPVPP